MSYFSSRFAVAASDEPPRHGQQADPRTSQEEGVDVLAVVAARHVLLSETDRVLALGDTVELLELLLGDALHTTSDTAQD